MEKLIKALDDLSLSYDKEYDSWLNRLLSESGMEATESISHFVKEMMKRETKEEREPYLSVLEKMGPAIFGSMMLGNPPSHKIEIGLEKLSNGEMININEYLAEDDIDSTYALVRILEMLVDFEKKN